MSCNILVFDKSKAPKTSKEMGIWLEEKLKWAENRDYLDTKGTSKELVDFFTELNQIFPAQKGKYSPTEEEKNSNPDFEEKSLDYVIGSDLIYISFPRTMIEDVVNTVKRLAFKHGLGYSDMIYIYWNKFKMEVLKRPGADKVKTKKSKKRILIDILCYFLLLIYLIFGIAYFVTQNLAYGLISVVFMSIAVIIGIKCENIE